MRGVNLKASVKASELLFEVLQVARKAHPEAFEGLAFPANSNVFRKRYASALIAFEARRLASPRRAEIARTIVEASQQSIVFTSDGGEQPLTEYLEGTAEPLRTETIKFDRKPGLVPELVFRGKHHEGRGVAELTDDWLARRWLTESAHRGIRWTLDAAFSSPSGRTEMVGHKIVSLGGGAELSPTRAMLRAGADVLFLDMRDPSRELREDPRVSGTLTFVPGGANLLTQPREIAATIARFAGNDPVHVGMYAYSGGAAQEWRLTASMNEIVRSLPEGLVRSVVLLISPTTPGAVSLADARTGAERAKRWWLKPLALGGVSGAGHLGDAGRLVSNSIVSLQGAAYQAAQYVGKMMAAEVYASFGTKGSGGITVSAPVAPITKTASLAHPLFDAGFEGAELFDILISEPQATRVMCALLAFHDLLNPDAPSRSNGSPLGERLTGIMGEQIHGGVFAQPYAIEREIALAAVAGLAKNPKLVPPAARYVLGKR